MEQEADWSLDLEVAGSQPVAASIPETAAACPTPAPFEVPSWLKEARYPSHANTKYVLSHIFTNQFCRKIAAKYRLAVYAHCDEGLEAQSKAVLSIPYHELDHRNSTVAQKEKYHKYCDDSCGFKKWLKDGNAAGDYQKKYTKDIHRNTVTWEHGAFAGMDTIFPNAFEELVCSFRDMGCAELMSGCTRL